MYNVGSLTDLTSLNKCSKVANIILRLGGWFEAHGFDLHDPTQVSDFGFSLLELPFFSPLQTRPFFPHELDVWPFQNLETYFEDLQDEVKVYMTQVVLPDMFSHFQAIEYLLCEKLGETVDPKKIVSQKTYLMELVRKEAELWIALYNGVRAKRFLHERENEIMASMKV